MQKASRKCSTHYLIHSQRVRFIFVSVSIDAARAFDTISNVKTNLFCRQAANLFGLFFILALLGCSDSAEYAVKTYQEPKVKDMRDVAAGTMSAIERSADAVAGEVLWQKPADWVEKPSDSMRMASFTIPGAGEKESGDASIVTLMGDGGGTVANVNRWRDQINLPELSELEILASAKTARGPIGEFKYFELINGDNAIYVSIIFSEKLNKTIFVKMAGPSALAERSRDSFLQLSRSITEGKGRLNEVKQDEYGSKYGSSQAG